MQIHQLRPKHKRKKTKRIGRGGKKGMSSGFGVQHGGSSQPRIREVLKRYPKLKGYRVRRFLDTTQVIDLNQLEKRFESGEVVSPETLAAKRIVRKVKGMIPAVKILGEGELTKALTVEKCKVSKSARAKIEKAGGAVKDQSDKSD